jgi:ParB-like chromosome segregation protein Spo0J
VSKILNIDNIRIDAGTQSREKIDEDVVRDYAECMADGVGFPPVEVMFDGVEYYLTDGFHRYHAHRKNGKVSIAALVTNGTLRDAKLASYAANGRHGLRPSNADKRKAVMSMLDDMEYSGWSNVEIAVHCAVSRVYVANLRKELETPKEKTSAKAKVGDKPLKDEVSTTDLPPETPPDNRAEEAMQMLAADNETLTQRLAVAAMDATEEEKALATMLIADYVEQIRILNIELVSVKLSRDRFQAENSELKKQVKSLEHVIKKNS